VRRAAAWLLAAALGGAGVAQAGGLHDLADAWLVPLEQASRLLGQPSARPATWSAGVSQGRLFGLPELPQCGLDLRWRGRVGAVEASWERLGRDLFREDTWRLAALVGGRWRGGARVGMARLTLAGVAASPRPEVTLRLQGEMAARIDLDVWWPLTDAPSWHGSGGLRRWLRVTGGGDGWVWSAAADRSADGTPALQGEVLVRLAPAGALGLRVEPWSGSVGLVTSWRIGGLLVRSSHLAHPDLGTCHRWGLTVERAP